MNTIMNLYSYKYINTMHTKYNIINNKANSIALRVMNAHDCHSYSYELLFTCYFVFANYKGVQRGRQAGGRFREESRVCVLCCGKD